MSKDEGRLCAAPRARVASLEPREDRVDLVEQLLDGAAVSAPVQEPCDRTEQVAKQVARPPLASDHQVHLVQVDDEPEQVEMERPEREVEDRAGVLLRGVDRRLSGAGDALAVRGSGENTVCDQLSSLGRDAGDGERAVQDPTGVIFRNSQFTGISRTTVTGPSFAISSRIRVPKTPVSTGTPSSRSAVQKLS